MKRFTITELTDCWIIDGEIQIPKKSKGKCTVKGIKRTWLDDFVFDLFNYFK